MPSSRALVHVHGSMALPRGQPQAPLALVVLVVQLVALVALMAPMAPVALAAPVTEGTEGTEGAEGTEGTVVPPPLLALHSLALVLLEPLLPAFLAVAAMAMKHGNFLQTHLLAPHSNLTMTQVWQCSQLPFKRTVQEVFAAH